MPITRISPPSPSVDIDRVRPAISLMPTLRGPRGFTGASGDVVNMSTRAYAITQTIGGGVTFLRVAGYALVGDGGDALYVRVMAEPAHEGKFQSADGAWWKLLVAVARPEMFGALGDGSTPDHAAIQNALDYAAAVGAAVELLAKTYYVADTIVAPRNARIVGAGIISTRLLRDTDYGDTITCGTGAFPNNAGGFEISGVWFQHGTAYTSGDVALDHSVTSGAHIRLAYGQDAAVRDCAFWRLPYSVVLDHCVVTELARNWFWSFWDPVNAGVQEGIAQVLLDGCQIITIERNYFTGWPSAARSVTWTATDASQTASAIEDVGSRYGLLIHSCEDLGVAANYFGRHSSANIYYYLDSAIVTLDHRIADNFFDGAKDASIYFATQIATVFVEGVTITGNVFNGELSSKNGIVSFNSLDSSKPTLRTFSITANTFMAFVGSPLVMIDAIGGVVADNVMTYYNCLAVSVTDVNFVAAGYFDTGSKFISIDGNVAGGLGVTDSFCKRGFVVGAIASITQRNNVNSGVSTSFADQQFASNEVPAADNTYDIGSASKQLRRLYVGTNGVLVSGTKVLGAQAAGWGLPTGTLTRTAFVSDSATTAQVAARLGALIHDLYDHGLIGA